MLCEGLFNVVVWLLNAILNVLDVLPSIPESLASSIDVFFALIFDNLALLGFFLPIPTAKLILPLMILIINFEKVYTFVLWILRKIPFVGIE